MVCPTGVLSWMRLSEGNPFKTCANPQAHNLLLSRANRYANGMVWACRDLGCSGASPSCYSAPNATPSVTMMMRLQRRRRLLLLLAGMLATDRTWLLTGTALSQERHDLPAWSHPLKTTVLNHSVKTKPGNTNIWKCTGHLPFVPFVKMMAREKLF